MELNLMAGLEVIWELLNLYPVTFLEQMYVFARQTVTVQEHWQVTEILHEFQNTGLGLYPCFQHKPDLEY